MDPKTYQKMASRGWVTLGKRRLSFSCKILKIELSPTRELDFDISRSVKKPCVSFKSAFSPTRELDFRFFGFVLGFLQNLENWALAYTRAPFWPLQVSCKISFFTKFGPLAYTRAQFLFFFKKSCFFAISSKLSSRLYESALLASPVGVPSPHPSFILAFSPARQRDFWLFQKIFLFGNIFQI